MVKRNVTALVGGQFGSEAKGACVQAIWDQYPIHVRVGAANAGHTGWIMGRKVVSQQLPMAAWAWGAYKQLEQQGAAKALLDEVTLPTICVGPGAVISLEILLREIEESGIPGAALFIDPRAHVITQEQIDREAASDLKERIGSTSTTAREGIGTATADRVMRAANCRLARDTPELFHYLTDVPGYLAVCDDPILLEGTQGTGLSLTTGFFPYTTSRNTTSAGLCADSGVAPNRLERVIGVFRTFPIRVAGNSGPFDSGSDEIQFEDLDVTPEVTTVTKLRRRIATFSDEQLKSSIYLNGLTEGWLAFFNYAAPSVEGKRYLSQMNRDELTHLNIWRSTFRRAGLPLVAVGTSPQDWIHLDRASDGSFSQILKVDTSE